MFKGNLHRTFALGLFFTLVCVWGSYFAFITYEKHNQEIITLVDELENQKRIIVSLQRELGDAAVKKGSVAVSVETDQKKLDNQVNLIKKHGISGIAQIDIQKSSGSLSRARRPNHTLDMDALSNSGGTVMHVISHTHWDREWYLSFETFRGRLVQLLDKVFKRIKEDDKFKHFHLDGQMIPVDDYLQIREDYRSQIIEANLAGKLALGPWYVQPDEYLASAEALVRNLQLGIIKAEAMGGASYVGYIPDSFGHVAQMPQILLGFGITNAVSGRGLEGHFGSEVWWEGPDGSRVLFIFLKKWYCNGLDMPGDRVGSHYWESKKHELVGAGATTSHLLLMNGCDHTSPDPNVGVLISHSSASNMKIVHSNMDDYIELVRREVDTRKINLQTRKGELRSGVEGLTNTLSNKISQKQANWRRQTMLERWVEPLEAFAWKLGGFNYDHDTIWYSWKILLENHPHDSICGCSSEEVHRDVDMRFEKLRQVTNQISATSAIRMAQIATRHRHSAQDGTKVVIFNPTNIPRKDDLVVVKVYGLHASSYLKAVDSQGREVAAHMVENRGSKWSYILPDVGFRQPRTESIVMVALLATVPSMGFEIYTLHASGQPVPDPVQAEIVTRDPMFHGVEEDKNEGSRKKRNLLEVNDEVVVEETESEQINEQGGVGVGGGMGRKLLAFSSGAHMENEHLSVTVESGGTIKVVHKASKKEYSDINKLEDVGDSGDQYAFRQSGRPVHGENARVVSVNHFKTHSVAKVELTLASIHMTVFYVLKRGSPRVDIRTEFTNSKNNHRVRALFPAPFARQGFADGQFEVIQRGPGWNYWPQCKFVMVTDGGSFGFTVANRGLPEYSLNEGHLGLTLLRGTDRIGDWGNFPVATAQDHGHHAMEYSFIPFAGEPESTTLRFGGSDLEGRKFNDMMIGLQPFHFGGFTPEIVVDMDSSDLEILTRQGALNSNNAGQMPTSLPKNYAPWEKPLSEAMEPNSLIDIRPATLVLSSIKKAEAREGLIVRLFNPYGETFNGQVFVSALLNMKRAYECRLDEKRISELTLSAAPQGQGQYVELTVSNKKIVTLEFI